MSGVPLTPGLSLEVIYNVKDADAAFAGLLDKSRDLEADHDRRFVEDFVLEEDISPGQPACWGTRYKRSAGR